MSSQPIRSAKTMPALIAPEDLQTAYANMVRIAHMPSEIVFDFALKLPGGDPASITARVMMSPLSAKLFHRAMAENLAKYEKTFGEIKVPGESNLGDYTQLFRPPPQSGKEDKEDGE